MNSTLNRPTLKRILQQGAKLAEEWPGTTPMMRELMAFWKEERPKLAATLTQAGAMEAYARIQEAEVEAREMELVKAMGIPAQEARAQARLEVLQMTPETWEEEDQQLEAEDRAEVEEAQNRQIHQERLKGDSLL